jgi:arginine deiminase
MTVSSETGRLRRVLLCRPEVFRWMPTNAVATATIARGTDMPEGLAQSQHGELVDALEGAGVTCEFFEQETHLPYATYTRDSSVMTPWGPILTQLRLPERRGEYAAVLRYYTDRAIDIWKFASIGSIEGGDVAIVAPGVAAIGSTGIRTDRDGANQLAGWLQAAGWDVAVVEFPEHFLHLDVIFSMVTSDLALANRDVCPPDFLTWLERHGIRTLDVSYADTMRLGCNVLSLGDDRVVSTRANTNVNQMLRAEGLSVLDPDLALFTAAGGGVHCLTMPLDREEP